MTVSVRWPVASPILRARVRLDDARVERLEQRRGARRLHGARHVLQARQVAHPQQQRRDLHRHAVVQQVAEHARHPLAVAAQHDVSHTRT